MTAEQVNHDRILLQRLGLRRRLRFLASPRNQTDSKLSSAAGEVLANEFDEFYANAVRVYVVHQKITVTNTDEFGTPILDKLGPFFKWLWESGMLEWLLKIWFGIEVPLPSSLSLTVDSEEFMDLLGYLTRLT